MRPTDVVVTALNADADLLAALSVPVSDSYDAEVSGPQVNVVLAEQVPTATGQGIDTSTGELMATLWCSAGKVKGAPDLDTAWDAASAVVRAVATIDRTDHAGWHVMGANIIGVAEQHNVPGGLARVVVQLTARVREAA